MGFQTDGNTYFTSGTVLTPPASNIMTMIVCSTISVGHVGQMHYMGNSGTPATSQNMMVRLNGSSATLGGDKFTMTTYDPDGIPGHYTSTARLAAGVQVMGATLNVTNNGTAEIMTNQTIESVTRKDATGAPIGASATPGWGSASNPLVLLARSDGAGIVQDPIHWMIIVNRALTSTEWNKINGKTNGKIEHPLQFFNRDEILFYFGGKDNQTTTTFVEPYSGHTFTNSSGVLPTDVAVPTGVQPGVAALSTGDGELRSSAATTPFCNSGVPTMIFGRNAAGTTKRRIFLTAPNLISSQGLSSGMTVVYAKWGLYASVAAGTANPTFKWFRCPTVYGIDDDSVGGVTWSAANAFVGTAWTTGNINGVGATVGGDGDTTLGQYDTDTITNNGFAAGVKMYANLTNVITRMLANSGDARFLAVMDTESGTTDTITFDTRDGATATRRPVLAIVGQATGSYTLPGSVSPGVNPYAAPYGNSIGRVAGGRRGR